MESLTFERESINTPLWIFRELSTDISGKRAYVRVNIYPNLRKITVTHLEAPIRKKGIGTLLLAKAAYELGKELPEVIDFDIKHEFITTTGRVHLKRTGLNRIANNKSGTQMNFGIYRTILVHKAKTLGFNIDE